MFVIIIISVFTLHKFLEKCWSIIIMFVIVIFIEKFVVITNTLIIMMIIITKTNYEIFIQKVFSHVKES